MKKLNSYVWDPPVYFKICCSINIFFNKQLIFLIVILAIYTNGYGQKITHEEGWVAEQTKSTKVASDYGPFAEFNGNFTGTPHVECQKVSTVARAGNMSMKFTVVPGTYTWYTSERAEIYWDPDLTTSDDKWFGISVYFPTNFQPPVGHWMFISQIWQNNANSSYGRHTPPPLDIAVGESSGVNNDDIFVVTRGNNSTTNPSPNNKISRKIVNNFPKGEWLDFVFRVKFSPSGSGILTVKYKRASQTNWEFDQTWTNQIIGFNSGGRIQQFKSGIYQGAACANMSNTRPDNCGKTFELYTDEMAMGNSEAEVTPGGSPPPPPPPSGDEYRLENKLTGDWLQSRIETTPLGSDTYHVVQKENTNTGNSTKWKLIDTGDGFHRIENVGTGYWLQSRNNVAPVGGSSAFWVVAKDNTNTGDLTKWKLVDAGNGYNRIENKGNGLWLQARDETTPFDPDTYYVVGKDNTNTGDRTRWKLVSTANARLRAEKAVVEDEPLALYPNPASGLIRIVGLRPGNKIDIYNNAGQKIFHTDIRLESMEIDVSWFKKGLYFVRTGKISLKFLVE